MVMISKGFIPAPRRSGKLHLRIWGLALLLGLPALAQTPPGEFTPFGQAFTQSTRAPKTQARVYAYRSAQTQGSAAPVNLYLNGRYHATLLRGGYTEFCTAPGSWSLQTAPNDAEQQHTGKQQSGTLLAPKAGQVMYLRVQDSGAQLTQVVPEAQALEELRRTRLQQHTVSRAPLAQTCSTDLVETSAMPAAAMGSVAAPVAKKVALQREYALETDALFEFGKTELRAVGFNAVEGLIHKIQRDYSRIDRIRVAGYTDAIGPAKLNRKLSLQRAQLVAQRLQERGLKPERGIRAEGHGAEELVKTDCRNAPTPANKACHAPNRRVVIVVYGLRR